MPHPLLGTNAIDEHPRQFLSRLGTVFAEFGASTQDSGNISYGIQMDGERFFVKTAGIPDDPEPFLNHADRVALLRNASLLSRSCDHPALSDLHHVMDSPVGPMLVYEWLDGELLGAPRSLRNDPQSAHQRFRRLPAAQVEQCLDQIYELHRDLARIGWVAVDFYDGCLIYDFSSGRLSTVDLDMYRRGPFRNDMGRMFGSSRFMAPEEFAAGSMIDQQTNVFVMGRAAAIFLSDGTLNQSPFRGSQALHRVMKRACAPDRRHRFASIETFYNAWRQARRT